MTNSFQILYPLHFQNLDYAVLREYNLGINMQFQNLT